MNCAQKLHSTQRCVVSWSDYLAMTMRPLVLLGGEQPSAASISNVFFTDQYSCDLYW
jgi:hypothetical protein